MNPLLLLSKIISPEYLFAEMTTRYGLHKETELDVTAADIGQFLGLFSLRSLRRLLLEYLCMPLVATVMPGTRFRQLKRFFHIVDNIQLKAGEQMAKIQPFYDEISKCFLQFGVFHESLSIDEAIVP